MALNRNRVRKYLADQRFADLFIEELGWDEAPNTPVRVEVDGRAVTARPVAQKRGVMVFAVALDQIPPAAGRRKIEGLVAKGFREHFMVFTEEASPRQVWQWVLREPGRVAGRSHEYYPGQSGESLIQKLAHIHFTIDQEGDLSLVDVVGGVRAAFNIERATKKFYQEFKKEHDRFQKFLAGIPDKEMESWYVSVMLNRLMFLYFIQKKGFLDGDRDYLRTKLIESGLTGHDRYYLDFLCPLFFEGFAKPADRRDPALARQLGNIPYLNGGIFQQHEVEQRHGRAIRIPDKAFTQIFDFFDRYQWHLDDRPLRNDNEINPDVLGYIFEQYINQKQMGAYYTKEDITDYIGKNTIIPFLFDQVQKACPAGFAGESGAWGLLTANPDRYIYEAVRKGVALDLPGEIAAGVEDVAQRGMWNTPTPEDYALPTEIWRETVARRQRYEEIWLKLAGGEVTAINDLITLNLDMRQFAQDVIEQTERPELVRAFWQALTQISVLDPTCGSGAFLFAALNILEPLYEACLARMQAFVDELESTASALKYKDFREVLAGMARHPNQTYFILKSIMVNNLYGVDIMAEATEIAKLRLFLKLVAQVEEVAKLEPLPDIDFNIRAGNTLVGFARYGDVEATVRGNRLLILPEDEKLLAEIREEAEAVDRLFGLFRAQQTAHDTSQWRDDYAETKAELRRRLAGLDERLNRLLAQQYGVDPDKLEFEVWRKSHQPFHWFVEFYGILKGGGFDVIVGNPPYVEYSQIRRQYEIRQFVTENSGNLYAYTIERCTNISLKLGRMGMIVQLPIVCTDRMNPLQVLMNKHSKSLWYANFDDRPGKLFDGLQHIRATIFLSQVCLDSSTNRTFSTDYNRWYSETRDTLFPLQKYEGVDDYVVPGVIPKIGTQIGGRLMHRLDEFAGLERYLIRRSQHSVFYHNAPQYWVRSMDYAPYFWNERDGQKTSTQMKSICLASQLDAQAIVAVLNSSIFYFWYITRSDCRHLNLRDIASFPIGLDGMKEVIKRELRELTSKLMVDLQANARRKESYYKTTGKVVYDEFSPRLSKPIIDQIDTVLAQHYGFTAEELDYIVNYDIKYRMGDELFEEEEE